MCSVFLISLGQRPQSFLKDKKEGIPLIWVFPRLWVGLPLGFCRVVHVQEQSSPVHVTCCTLADRNIGSWSSHCWPCGHCVLTRPLSSKPHLDSVTPFKSLNLQFTHLCSRVPVGVVLGSLNETVSAWTRSSVCVRALPSFCPSEKVTYSV